MNHDFFPGSISAVQFAAAIGHGLLAAALLALITRWTKISLLGWFAVILYMTFPSNYYLLHSVASTDYQFYVSLLTLGVLLQFHRLTSGSVKSTASFLINLFLWFGLLWLTIKLKSSEKILPFVCGAFLVVTLRGILKHIGKERVTLLFLGLLLSLIMVIPMLPFETWLKDYPAQRERILPEKLSSKKDKQAFAFSIQNGIQRTFFVTGGDMPFLTPYRKKSPRSFTENFGFFMAWLFWVGVPLTPLLLRKQTVRDRLSNVVDVKKFEHFYLLTGIWFAAIAAGFSSGMSLQDLRFLNFAYVPGLLLLFLTLGLLIHLSSTRKVRAFLLSALAIAVLVTCVNNFLTLLQDIRHFGGMQDTVVRIEKDIFYEIYGRPPGPIELYERHNELNEHAIVVGWYQLGENWAEGAKQKLSNARMLFYLSDEPDPERLRHFSSKDLRVALWRTYSPLEAKPLFFRILKTLREFKEKVKGPSANRKAIYVYKITEVPVGNNSQAG